MPIVEKITHEDLALYEIFKNPSLFAEFIANVDNQSPEENFELTSYQKEFMLDL